MKTDNFALQLAVEQLKDSDTSFLLLIKNNDARQFHIESAVEDPEELKWMISKMLEEYGKIQSSFEGGYDAQEHEESEDE